MLGFLNKIAEESRHKKVVHFVGSDKVGYDIK